MLLILMGNAPRTVTGTVTSISAALAFLAARAAAGQSISHSSDSVTVGRLVDPFASSEALSSVLGRITRAERRQVSGSSVSTSEVMEPSPNPMAGPTRVMTINLRTTDPVSDIRAITADLRTMSAA